MAKKDGYIFWCSKCKIDHAGECETEAVTETEPKPYAGLTAWLPIQGQYIYYYNWSKPVYNGVIEIDGVEGYVGP